MNIITAIEQEYVKNDVPVIKVGDTVKVHIKIKEGSRERIQIFECIGNVFSTPTPEAILLTVKVSLIPPFCFFKT